MLGWNVNVREVDEVEGQKPIANWTADPGLLSEMEVLVAEDEAFLVKNNGGYPYVFEVYSDIIRVWLEDGDSRLHQMFRNSDLYKLYVNYERLDAVPDGVLLSVSMMDQS